MATKTTAPAVPAAPTATPPAADTGAGTSADKALLDQLTSDDDGPGDLPPASDEPKDALDAGNDLPATPAAPQAAAPASSDPAHTSPDHEAYENTFPGRPGFNPETASAAAIEEHVRILKARKKLKALLNPEQPAAPAPAAIAAASTPVPVTIVAAPAATTFTALGTTLIGKHDSATGLVQQLPQKLWDQLSPEDAARFSEAPVQPEKPVSLI